MVSIFFNIIVCLVGVLIVILVGSAVVKLGLVLYTWLKRSFPLK